MFQNFWNAPKTVIHWKVIALNIFVRKKESSKLNNLSFNPRKLEKQEKIKSKVSEKKEKSEHKSVN